MVVVTFFLRMPHLGAFHPSFRVGGVYLRHNFLAIKSIHVEATHPWRCHDKASFLYNLLETCYPINEMAKALQIRCLLYPGNKKNILFHNTIFVIQKITKYHMGLGRDYIYNINTSLKNSKIFSRGRNSL